MVDMDQAGDKETEMSELHAGSIIQDSMGDFYIKLPSGRWRVLIELTTAKAWDLNDLGPTKLIYEEKEVPLEKFPVGTAIIFDGRYIAVRHRPDFWSMIGTVGELTTEELEDRIKDKSTIKRLVEEN